MGRKPRSRSPDRQAPSRGRCSRADGKTLTLVAKSEADAVRPLHDRLTRGATLYADEASHWDAFHARYVTKRINHSIAYSHDGACTNQAESFFSRLRRAEIGIHHKIAGPYLAAYAAEMDCARITGA